VGKKGNCCPELVEFLITLGKQNGERNRVLCAEILLSCKKRTRRIVCRPSIPLSSHQGEREKNEYLYDAENAAELSKSGEIKL
jgi:hypothetical protein